jgi:hypothetical protein
VHSGVTGVVNLKSETFIQHPLLAKLGLDESWMGWHSFRRFRNSWLRSQRCLDDILMHWVAHKPLTMSETYSALKDDLDKRWAEVANVGYGFLLPGEDVPNVPRISIPEGSRKSRAKRYTSQQDDQSGRP